jgi:hypothetical protein
MGLKTHASSRIPNCNFNTGEGSGIARESLIKFHLQQNLPSGAKEAAEKLGKSGKTG